jgi:hypothetical protein
MEPITYSIRDGDSVGKPNPSTTKMSKRLGVTAICVSAFAWLLLGNEFDTMGGQSTAQVAPPETDAVFSPAHASLGEAIRHFLGWRPTPVQPIPFSHNAHVAVVDLQCGFCHDGVTIGPRAGIPSVETCMLCHFQTLRSSDAIEQLASYYERGEEPPWQRVYGWYEEAHVRFNHMPHSRRGIDCSVCHGEVAGMETAQRAVEHTMAFCVDCHAQQQASNECMTCHY